MLINTYEKDGRKSEIYRENNQYLVRLYENGILMDERGMAGHGIHYAESLAENYIERIGSFNTTKQFIRD
jgi:hypothetical protein